MNKILILIVGILLFSACADDNLGPILTFDKAEKGAYVKLLEESPRLLDLANLNTAAYNYSVEFVDVDQGSSVTEFDIIVRYVDNNPDNGDDSQDFKLLKTITSFGTSENGFVSADVEVTFAELVSLFGLNAQNVKANDQFRFNTAIKTSNGQRFDADNSSSAVNGSAFGGHFQYTLTATCPLPESMFVGSYTMTYENAGSQAFGPLPLGADGSVVELKISNSTIRTFDFVYLESGGFGQNADSYPVEFVCDQVRTVSFETGLGCGAGGIGIAQSKTIYPQDISDDSVIRLGGVEFSPDGGCGVGATEFVIVLTKN